MSRAFASIPIPDRPPKPRARSLTVMIDWGLELRAVEDLMEEAHEFTDLAKVAVGISGLVSHDFLTRKVAAYQAYAVDPFPGGMFLEYAFHHRKATEYLAECVNPR
ncbi:MAG: phosphosulfolactate synthase [Candidatus Rokubacteria bacterium]|nr:phosphosulfolactate synthase [Candidatus Rokubacteria bacterium]